MTKNQLPRIENIHLLAKPILHYSIFGVAPREIMGEESWKEIKKTVQARANHNCEICGRYVPHTSATNDWLHTHEVYDVDHAHREYTFSRFIGICAECHYYIHQGYLFNLFTQGEISEEYLKEIVDKGDKLLRSMALKKSVNVTISKPYTLLYNGERYINDFYPEIALKLHSKGVHILPCESSLKKLPEQFYYKRKG